MKNVPSSQQFHEIAASEVAQHNVVRGIMAKALSDAGGDEKKTIAYYIKYRAAQLAQEAREQLGKQRRAARGAARQRTISEFRQPIFGALSALSGVLTLIFGLLTIFFGLGAVGAALDKTAPPAVGIILCFLIAVACGLLAAVCGYLLYRCIKAGTRKRGVDLR